MVSTCFVVGCVGKVSPITLELLVIFHSLRLVSSESLNWRVVSLLVFSFCVMFVIVGPNTSVIVRYFRWVARFPEVSVTKSWAS